MTVPERERVQPYAMPITDHTHVIVAPQRGPAGVAQTSPVPTVAVPIPADRVPALAVTIGSRVGIYDTDNKLIWEGGPYTEPVLLELDREATERRPDSTISAAIAAGTAIRADVEDGMAHVGRVLRDMGNAAASATTADDSSDDVVVVDMGPVSAEELRGMAALTSMRSRDFHVELEDDSSGWGLPGPLVVPSGRSLDDLRAEAMQMLPAQTSVSSEDLLVLLNTIDADRAALAASDAGQLPLARTSQTCPRSVHRDWWHDGPELLPCPWCASDALREQLAGLRRAAQDVILAIRAGDASAAGQRLWEAM